MKFSITEKHIAKGSRRGTSTCPTALAIKDVVPKGTKIFAGGFYIQIDEKQFVTPRVLRRFMADFENRIEVQPIEVELI